jgi:RND family efflux transporter MFP subunit
LHGARVVNAIDAAPDTIPTGRTGHRRELIVIIAGTALLILGGGLLLLRADHKVNHVALGASPRPVTVVEALAKPYRDSRSYVGAVESWVEASVGPQYISAYVETVLVRPGDRVQRGQVLATLDCSNPSAASRAVEMQARSVELQQRAVADESTRENSMLSGGFISTNEVEKKSAQSSSLSAQSEESKARVMAASLDVHDCALKAPFDGEIAERTRDPGAFVHPGDTIVSVVDRDTVRVTVDAPEKDFNIVSPPTPARIKMLSTGVDVTGPISRRAPRADPQTRTVHFEVDIADPTRQFPTGSTAIVQVDVGQPVPATEIPLYAASHAEGKVTLFEIDKNVAHLHDLVDIGERGGSLFFDPKVLPEKTVVVTEGRALLSDGDAVTPHLDPATTDTAQQAGTRGGGFGGPI